MPAPPLPPGSYGEITAHRTDRGWKARVEVRYRGGSRQAFRRFRKTRAEAVAACRAVAEVEKLKLDRGDVGAAHGLSDTATIEQLLTTYIEENQDRWSAATLRQYRHTASTYVAPVSGVMVRELSPAALTQLAKSLSPAAWKSARALLGGAYRWALATGQITTPSPVTATRSAPASGGKGDIAPVRAIRAFHSAAVAYTHPEPGAAGPKQRVPWLPPLILVSLATAARVGEIAAARWDCYDGESLTLHMTKAKRDKRVQLPEFAVSAIEEWRAQLDPRSVEVVPWLFPTATGRHVSTAMVARAWRAVLEAAPAEAQAVSSNHVLRRSAASWVDAVDGLEAAERLLGHRGASVAERHYLRTPLVETAAILQEKWDSV